MYISIGDKVFVRNKRNHHLPVVYRQAGRWLCHSLGCKDRVFRGATSREAYLAWAAAQN